jgi:S1-C subfamily serine protease
MYEFTCPNCQARNRAKTVATGQVAACARCKVRLRVVPREEGENRSGAGKRGGGWNTPLLAVFGGLAGLAVASVLLVVWYVAGPAAQPAEARPALERIKEWAEVSGEEKEKKEAKEQDKGPTPAAPATAAEQPALTGEQIAGRLLKSACWIVAQETQGKKVLIGHGSGTLIDRDQRLVLTNEHVANERSTAVRVLFPMRRGGKLVTDNAEYIAEINRGGGIKATVLRPTDRRRDLALLQLERLPDDEVVPLRVAARAPQTGQQIHTLGGSPRGNQGQWIYSPGTVRGVFREKWRYEDGIEREAEVIASTVPINPGDSGGGVVNDRCALVGVNNAFKGGNANYRHVSVSEVIEFLTSHYRALGKAWAPTEDVGAAVAEKDTDRWMGDLESDDKEARTRAVHELRDLGPGARKAIPALLPVARDLESDALREAAVEALMAIGAPNRDDMALVIDALREQNEKSEKNPPELRRYAASALGPIAARATDATNALVMAATDRDPEVRRNVAASLGRAGEAVKAKAVPVLIRLLRDPNSNVRWAAWRALDRFGRPEAKEINFAREKATLLDRSVPAEARLYACDLLNRGEDPTSALCEALHADTPAILAILGVLTALEERKPKTKEVDQALSRALDHKVWLVRAKASRVLVTIGFDPVLFPSFLKAVSSLETNVYKAPLEILKAHSRISTFVIKDVPPLNLTRDSLAGIKAALNGPDPLARQVSAYALGTLGEEGAAAAPELRAALKKETMPLTRLEMLATFAQMGPAAVKEMAGQGDALLDELAKVATDARSDPNARKQQVCAAIALVRLAAGSNQAKQAYPVLAKAMLLPNVPRPAGDPPQPPGRFAPPAAKPPPVDLVAQELHERAKQALALGGRDGADELAKVCRNSFLGRAGDTPGVQLDKRHARKTACEVLARIGPEANIPSVRSLIALIRKFGRAGREFPDVIEAANEASTAISAKRPKK